MVVVYKFRRLPGGGIMFLFVLFIDTLSSMIASVPLSAFLFSSFCYFSYLVLSRML